jgi:hypothetical protein
MAQLNGWQVPALPGAMPGMGDRDPQNESLNADAGWDERSAMFEAADQIAATPTWMAIELCDDMIGKAETKPVDVLRLCRGVFDPAERTDAELFAICMAGLREHAAEALFALRSRIAARPAIRELIRDRADELMAEDVPSDDDGGDE